jgi:medium-chain acyl-[acyl-carrier-protein] hydrolase
MMSADAGSLVRIGTKEGHKDSLVCIPHAGAGVAAFASWETDITDVAALWAARFPGRENRILEDPLVTIESMADSLFEPVLALKADNLVLYGDCSGGLVAYELAHRIVASGREPGALSLVVNSQLPPTAPRGPVGVLSNLPYPEIIEYLKNTSDMDREILENSEFMELLLPAIRSDIAAMEQYVHQDDRPKLTFPIIAIGDQGNDDSFFKALHGWRELTSAEFQLIAFDINGSPSSRDETVRNIVRKRFADHVKQ